MKELLGKFMVYRIEKRLARNTYRYIQKLRKKAKVTYMEAVSIIFEDLDNDQFRYMIDLLNKYYGRKHHFSCVKIVNN